MRTLVVPNWSFGRNRALEGRFRDVLVRHELAIHYLQGDVDHNRTVSAFSGSDEVVFVALLELAKLAFDTIDLNRHVGVHPRIGALDVCPFLPLDGSLADVLALAERFGRTIADRFGVPVYLYEKSERGRHEADLPSLRRGGFGGLLGKALSPDFGPNAAHLRLGVSVVGVRDFLIALNVDLPPSDPRLARTMAREMRQLREDGDGRFLGVRALGFPLASREISQLSMNLTLPDLSPVDPILEWVDARAREADVAPQRVELIGVIRRKDLEHATRVPVRAEQIIDV